MEEDKTKRHRIKKSMEENIEILKDLSKYLQEYEDAPDFSRLWTVPRSLISKRVKIPPVLFTRIGVEANSGRVSLVRGNLKSLRLSLARSTSEPEVGYAGDD
ncbi:MAG: hypothetical protein IMF20_01855, partial [Proteobacteria bacterium]|nr:hypothetical protein [Pseudomonadota bacterium]